MAPPLYPIAIRHPPAESPAWKGLMQPKMLKAISTRPTTKDMIFMLEGFS